MSRFSESVAEDAVLAWLEAIGYEVLQGPEIAASEPGAERDDWLVVSEFTLPRSRHKRRPDSVRLQKETQR